MKQIRQTIHGQDVGDAAADGPLNEADVYHIIDMIHTSFCDHRREDDPMFAILERWMEEISTKYDVQMS